MWIREMLTTLLGAFRLEGLLANVQRLTRQSDGGVTFVLDFPEATSLRFTEAPAKVTSLTRLDKTESVFHGIPAASRVRIQQG
jgi:hypothetical protein